MYQTERCKRVICGRTLIVCVLIKQRDVQDSALQTEQLSDDRRIRVIDVEEAKGATTTSRVQSDIDWSILTKIL